MTRIETFEFASFVPLLIRMSNVSVRVSVRVNLKGTSYRMSHIEAKSINIWLRYDPKCNITICKEVGLHFGSYLSQMLMDFDSIWLILKLTVPYGYNGCDIRMSGYPFTGKIIRMCEYSSHSLEALARGLLRQLISELMILTSLLFSTTSLVRLQVTRY